MVYHSMIDDMHYRITIVYDAGDQRELLIRILSFGPMIRVIEPDDFIKLIKIRLVNQKSVDTKVFALFFP